jgi:hypothetical protein
MLFDMLAVLMLTGECTERTPRIRTCGNGSALYAAMESAGTDAFENLPKLSVSSLERIGSGHSSIAARGLLEDGTVVALKRFEEPNHALITKEIAILSALSGHNHVVYGE